MHITQLLNEGIMKADNSEQVILDPKIIARSYMRTWFFLDLISSVPLDYIFLILNTIQGATTDVSHSRLLSPNLSSLKPPLTQPLVTPASTHPTSRNSSLHSPNL